MKYDSKVEKNIFDTALDTWESITHAQVKGFSSFLLGASMITQPFSPAVATMYKTGADLFSNISKNTSFSSSFKPADKYVDSYFQKNMKSTTLLSIAERIKHNLEAMPSNVQNGLQNIEKTIENFQQSFFKTTPTVEGSVTKLKESEIQDIKKDVSDWFEAVKVLEKLNIVEKGAELLSTPADYNTLRSFAYNQLSPVLDKMTGQSIALNDFIAQNTKNSNIYTANTAKIIRGGRLFTTLSKIGIRRFNESMGKQNPILTQAELTRDIANVVADAAYLYNGENGRRISSLATATATVAKANIDLQDTMFSQMFVAGQASGSEELVTWGALGKIGNYLIKSTKNVDDNSPKNKL